MATLRRYLFVFLLLILIGAFVVYDSRKQIDNNPITDNENGDTMGPSLVEHIDPKSEIVFNYPAAFPTLYVTPVSWPPHFTLSAEPFTCGTEEEATTMSDDTGHTTTINNTEYCIRGKTEGAAGSIFRDYSVNYEKDGLYLNMSFAIRHVQCGNYSIEQAQACEQEQASFDLYGLIDQVAQSAHLQQQPE